MTPDDLKKECDVCREKLAERFASMEHRLTTLEVTLWGQRGENGLRGTLLDLTRKMDMLLRFFWVASALPPLTFGVLGVLKFFDKL